MVGGRHDTLGNFRSVASVTREGQFDATYFVVGTSKPGWEWN